MGFRLYHVNSFFQLVICITYIQYLSLYMVVIRYLNADMPTLHTWLVPFSDDVKLHVPHWTSACSQDELLMIDGTSVDWTGV